MIKAFHFYEIKTSAPPIKHRVLALIACCSSSHCSPSIAQQKDRGASYDTPLCFIVENRDLEHTVGTQQDEYYVAKNQTHDTYDETYLNHVLLLNETSSVCQGIGRCTDGEYHTY